MSSINAAVVTLGSSVLFAVLLIVFGLLLLRFFGVALMVVPSVFPRPARTPPTPVATSSLCRWR